MSKKRKAGKSANRHQIQNRIKEEIITVAEETGDTALKEAVRRSHNEPKPEPTYNMKSCSFPGYFSYHG